MIATNWYSITNIRTLVCFDGNGNTMALADTSTGVVTSQYDYGAAGETMRLTSPTGAANPFRFSTKLQDEETGLSYYGRRFYALSIGKWLSLDPIGETGGMNLSGFLNNDPVNVTDARGLKVEWSNGKTVDIHSTTITNWPPPNGTYEFAPSAMAATVPRLSIKAVCTKAPCSWWGDIFRWHRQVVKIEFHSESHYRPSSEYAPGVEGVFWSFEQDHVNDFSTWAKDVGEPLAVETDKQFGSSYWVIQSACESAVEKAIQAALAPSLRVAGNASARKWDDSGKHTFPNR
jgi:RHS repeat-associated protein